MRQVVFDARSAHPPPLEADIALPDTDERIMSNVALAATKTYAAPAKDH